MSVFFIFFMAITGESSLIKQGEANEFVVAELSETLEVVDTLPDLSVTGYDITANVAPVVNDTCLITVTVHNVVKDAECVVSVYLNKAELSHLLGRRSIWVAANKFSEIVVPWVPEEVAKDTVIVKLTNAVPPESDTTNNTAAKVFLVTKAVEKEVIKEPRALSVTFNSSYITKVEKVAGLPVAVIFVKPTIEYGRSWGGVAEDFYVSVDCVTDDSSIAVELGANCFKVGPFYRRSIGGLELTASIGFLRIDAAALATGEFGGYSYAGTIDEERNGFYGGLTLRHEISELLCINPFFSFGIVRRGSFREYGGLLAFKPFKYREVAPFLKKLAITTGVSLMQLGTETEAYGEYSILFGYYLVGVRYEMWGSTPEKRGEK